MTLRFEMVSGTIDNTLFQCLYLQLTAERLNQFTFCFMYFIDCAIYSLKTSCTFSLGLTLRNNNQELYSVLFSYFIFLISFLIIVTLLLWKFSINFYEETSRILLHPLRLNNAVITAFKKPIVSFDVHIYGL